MKLLLIVFVSFGMSRSDERIEETCAQLFKSNIEKDSTEVYNSSVYYFNSSGSYALYTVIDLHVISEVTHYDAFTILCVGFNISTSDTIVKSVLMNRVTVKLIVLYEATVPAGLVYVPTGCWSVYGNLDNCSSLFIPIPAAIQSPYFLYSAMDQQLWSYFQDEHFFNHNWIAEIGMGTFEGSISASSLSQISISSLKTLRVYGNKWPHPQKLLGALPSLTGLDLTNNGIQEIPEDVFVKNPQLTHLTVDNNSICSFPNGLSRGVESLEIANQSNCGSFVISRDTFLSYHKLDYLDISHTHFPLLNQTLFKHQSLRHLKVIGCGIREIENVDESDDFKNTHLTNLNLDFNSLTYLPIGSFSTLVNLLQLSLMSNSLVQIENNSLSGLTKLQYLDLSNNSLSSIDVHAFASVPNLAILDVSYNDLLTLHHGLFSPLKTLVILSVENNSLQETPVSAATYVFAANNEIESFIQDKDTPTVWIDLSGNTISKLKLETVKHLNLSYNSLSYITENMWDSLSKLTSLDLGGNKFRCCSNNWTYFHHPISILNLNTSNPIWCYEMIEGKMFRETIDSHSDTTCSKSGSNNVSSHKCIVLVFVLFLGLVDRI